MGRNAAKRSLPETAKSSSELADHFESLSVSPPSTPPAPEARQGGPTTVRRSSRVASRNNSLMATPCRPAPRASQGSSRTRRTKAAKPSGGGRKSKGSRKSHGTKKSSRIPRGLRHDDIESGSEDDPLLAVRNKVCRPGRVNVPPLPGREQEFDLICEKIGEAVRAGQGCCIYISGVPGTGKTATVRQSIKYLKGRGREGFEYLEINGMKLSDVSQTYSILWQHVSGKSLSGPAALRRLSAHFSKGKRKPLVVLLDELDLLLKKRASILYHFFEWSGWPSARLIVVAIANTMDLPERFLPNRIASRMGTNRINFKPYTYPQLMAIIKYSRTEWTQRFHPDALEYCARKVSAVSGDARRALSLASRAIDWAQSNPTILPANKLITIPIMEQAIQMTFAGNPVQIMGDIALQQKVLLLALVLGRRSGGTSSVPFEQVCNNHWQLLRANGMEPVGFATLQRLFAELERMKLVARQDPSFRSPVVASSVVTLRVPEEEVAMALHQVAIFQKHLQV